MSRLLRAFGLSNSFELDTREGTTTAIEVEQSLPDRFEVYQNYPNPFNPSTTIRFAVPKSEEVVINIYDITGNYIQTLVNSFFSAGTYEVQWDGRNISGYQVSAGIYFYRVKSGKSVVGKKMMLLK